MQLPACQPQEILTLESIPLGHVACCLHSLQGRPFRADPPCICPLLCKLRRLLLSLNASELSFKDSSAYVSRLSVDVKTHHGHYILNLCRVHGSWECKTLNPKPKKTSKMRHLDHALCRLGACVNELLHRRHQVCLRIAYVCSCHTPLYTLCATHRCFLP